MRILHTADWHLGHVLLDQDREEEHRAFLTWLLDLLESEEVDALLVCGDVFDGANPPASAQAAWYGFLGEAAGRCRGLQVVAIAGNHDSPSRLTAPAPVLSALDVTVFGALPRDGGRVEAEKLVVPLRSRRAGPGAPAEAWVAAVPHVRIADAAAGDGGDPAAVVDGVRAVYASALDAARVRRGEGQALVATGHCFLQGTRISEESERKVLGGNLNPLPPDLFPDDVAYAALGHLHLPQTVAGRENVRYSGSPIPLSLDEDRYPHQVCLVDLDGGRFAGVTARRVPRRVEILRLPEEGPGEPAAVLDLLRRLPPAPGRAPLEPDLRPYLEVRVRLDRSNALLKQEIEDALEGRDARLVKITPVRDGTPQALADAASVALGDLSPGVVFRRLWEQKRDGEPPPEALAAFHELVDLAAQEEET